MPNLIDLRRRIRSVKNTQQITSAMKMVSAAKLRRAQDRVIAARPYASLMRDMLGSILVQLPEDSSVFEHELLQRREEKRIAILLISADKGLCGAFNSNVVRFATRFLSENPDKEITLQCVGRRGRDFFHRKRVSITREWVNLFARPIEFSQAKQIASDLMQSFREKETDVIYLLHNEFKSALAQTVVFRRLLPIQPAEGDKSAAVDYIYEQPLEDSFRNAAATLRRDQRLSGDARIRGCRACRANDSHGRCYAQRRRNDRQAYPTSQSRAAGEHYKGIDRGRQRSRSALA